MRRELTELSVRVPEGCVVAEPAESKPASVKAKVVAAIGGIALVGAAIGVAIGAPSGTDGTSAQASGASYSAELAGLDGAVGIAAGVRGGGVRGRADLDVDNVLTWKLRKLEKHASGTIHINTGRSCDDLASSLWDAEAGPNPWPTVSWSSDSNGKSSGSLDLDEIAGAYSFAANLGHAVVFYSSDEQLLACGVLKPEGDYRKFGVRSELNGGFVVHQDEATAGEVLVSKDNVMTWGMFNLEADQTGVVSVLAGGDCSNPDNTLFTGEWQTDKWGIAQGELALDSAVHDFARVVDRAVAFRNADGAVVACGTLSLFVEKMNQALRAVRQELKDIETTYESGDSEAAPPTAPPTDFTPSPPTSPPTELSPDAIVREVKKFWIAADSCYEAGKTVVRISPQIETYADYIRVNKAANTAAEEAVKQNTATPEQEELVEEYAKTLQLHRLLYNNRLMAIGTFYRTCYTTTCISAREQFLSTESQFNDATQQLEFRNEEFTAALAAIEAGSASPQQEESAALYQNLVNQKTTADESAEELKASILSGCPADTWCTLGSERFPLENCGPYVACNNEKFQIAEQSRKYDKAYERIYRTRGEYELALEAKTNGSATEEQKAFLEEYRIFQHDKALLESSIEQGMSAIESNAACFPPEVTGTVTLSPGNILSWQLNSLQPNQKGRIVIDKSSFCMASGLGNQAALEGTAPYDQVLWDTTDGSTSDSGSVDLSTLPGTLQFQEMAKNVVVIYTAENVGVSCGRP